MSNFSSQVIRTVLDKDWRVQEAPRSDAPEHRRLAWLNAEVPGHIHLDLMRDGVIGDPFVRMNERGVEWVDETDWVYETRFQVEELTPAHRALVFHGLDTLAEIELNGEALGRTENMFMTHRFPVDGRLNVGENTLRVTFRSATRVGRARQEAWEVAQGSEMPGHWDSWAPRSFVRKAQYMYGWDWGPVLSSCGIWAPVELVTVPLAEIGDWKYEYDFLDSGEVSVRVTATVERRAAGAGLTLDASVAGENWTGSISAVVPEAIGVHEIALPAVTINARLWQPRGLGDAARYPLRIALRQSSEEIDALDARVGFRTVQLIREPDMDGAGETFKFRVNGVNIFAKGANWIPDDSFITRVTEERLRERITQARDAGFNMLRIWAGGFYESEAFYNICDELGILVWQDFLYGCAYYPDLGEYAEGARLEAAQAVRRIRNHPSLCLWCGNNENHTMFADKWNGLNPSRHIGEHLYHEILPEVLAAEDPATPYWPSSPYGGDLPNSANAGDCHNWDVWHGRGDWVHYTENDSRFCSEFGFAASCGMAAWEGVLAPEDRAPHSPVVKWHDKTRKGYDTYIGMQDIHFPVSQTLEDLVYYSQCNQGEAMRYGVEHYRRRMGHCWGTLIWQLNDCWPVQSWAMIDSAGEPKAVYYAAKRFYAPQLLSLYRKGDIVEAHLVNDRSEPIPGVLTITLLGFDGETIQQTETKAKAPANAAAIVTTFDLSAAKGRERSTVLHARFAPADGTPAFDSTLLLAEPKDLELGTPSIHTRHERIGEHEIAVTLTSETFAPYLWLRRGDNTPLTVSDNFFHLMPGEAKTVIITANCPCGGADLADKLVARTLADRSPA
ncbi:beta-mannosidase [Capsulimonas corticalis]|uniref:Beta-mannosidase B n=1 Tax=Capsulimonas corticalis TaxID=2219043 RepID=A0A402D1F0_9BACT|nr:glycoside hydrolase family 2 protein [Capsulimonas corticalis]BDI31625.1 beta-mannosidase [Capsulimonas corticalis]